MRRKFLDDAWAGNENRKEGTTESCQDSRCDLQLAWLELRCTEISPRPCTSRKWFTVEAQLELTSSARAGIRTRTGLPPEDFKFFRAKNRRPSQTIQTLSLLHLGHTGVVCFSPHLSGVRSQVRTQVPLRPPHPGDTRSGVEHGPGRGAVRPRSTGIFWQAVPRKKFTKSARRKHREPMGRDAAGASQSPDHRLCPESPGSRKIALLAGCRPRRSRASLISTQAA